MPSLRRSKSKKDRAAETAKRTAKKAAKTVAIVQVAKRTPVKRLPLIAGAAIAAFVALKLVRGHGGDAATA